MNKYLILSCVLFLLFDTAYSQLNQIILSGSDSGNKTYVANQKIEFLPGYSFTASSADRLVAYIDAGVIVPSYYTDLFTESAFENRELNTNYSVGSVSGTPNVSETGAFTYSVPIQIPLGTNGMVPQLGIGYSSQSGNGLLGMGWDLQGLSVISRTNKDFYHDDEVRAIQFNNSDVFALDGRRLLGVSGTYGANGAEYGTESEDFSRIYSHGNQGGGPAWFEVKTKEGYVIEYGKTIDARLIHGTTVLFWMINKITDSHGNYVSYIYENVNEEFRIKEIHYTGNSSAGISPYNVIQIKYKERADQYHNFINYKKIESKSVIDNILILTSGQQVKKYEFKYGCKLYSFLNEIIEYGSGSDRVNSTIFKYSIEDEGEIETIEGLGSNQLYLTGDFNGDGKTDIIKVSSSSSTPLQNGNDRVVISNNLSYQILSNTNNIGLDFQQIGSTSITSSNSIIFGYSGGHSYYGQPGYGMNLFDFDGDGKTDIFYYEVNSSTNSNNVTKHSISGVKFHRAEVNNEIVSFSLSASTIQSLVPHHYIRNINRFSFIGDYNGDGISDILYVTQNENGNQFKAGIIRGGSFNTNMTGIGSGNQQIANFSQSEMLFLASADRVEVIDYDGDGKHDIMIIKDTITKIYSFNKGNPVPFSAELLYQAGFPTKWHEFDLGDFNGDGRTDILTKSADGTKFTVHYSRSNNWFEPKDYTFKNTGYDSNLGGLIVSDFNGDGKTDIIHHHTQGDHPRMTIYYSSGEKFNTENKILQLVTDPLAVSPAGISRRALTGNFTGKSNTLILPIGMFGSIITHYGHLDLNQLFKLTKIKDGFNNKLEIDYTNIDNNSIGNYGQVMNHPSSPNYPISNFNYPLLVVKQIISPTPIGSTAVTEYAYWGGKFHKKGKGFLGFLKIDQVNSLTGITITSEYEIDPIKLQPYLRKLSTFFTSNQNPVSETEYEHQFITSLPNNRYLHLTTKEETINHIHGRISSTIYDYNNATGNLNTSTTDNDGIETTVKTYSYGTFGSTLNIPNKITLSTVSVTRNGEAPFSSTSYFNYNVQKGSLIEAIQNYGTADAVTKILEYDGCGNITKETLSASGITPRIKEYFYDSQKRLVVKNVNELGQESFTQYHSILSKPIKITDIHGLISEITYDEFGRELTTTDPLGNTLSKSYEWVNISPQNPSSNVLQADDVMWKITSFGPGVPTQTTFLNRMGMKRKIQMQGMSNDIISIIAYNEKGLTITETAPFFEGASEVLVHEYTYDDFNRLIKEENQSGETTITYQSVGGILKTTTTHPDGALKTIEEDASGKLTKAIDEGGTLTYSYSSHGGMKEVKLDGTTVATSEYDNLGRQTKLIDANAGETSYTYDVLGKLITQTNANNKTTQITYDANGRLIQQTIPGRILNMEYYTQGNGLNQIKKITYNEGTEEFIYDQFQRPLEMKRTIDGQEFVFKYTYDQFGNVQKLEYPSGYFVKNTYDSKGHLVKVTDPGNAVLWQADEQDAMGRIIKFTKGDGIQTEMKYNYLNVLEEIKAGNVQYHTYLTDLQNGNLLERKDLVKGLVETFQYDNTERLTKMSSSPLSNPMLTFNNIETEYADNGNISFKTDVGNYVYHTEKTNAVIGVENPNELISFNTQQITYNAFAKTKTITEGNQRMYFTYGSDDERVMTKLVELDGSNETMLMKKYFFGLYEKEVEGSAIRHINYVSAGDGTIAIVVQENTETNTYFIYKDHLGSIVALTDEEGDIFFEQSFDAWGRYRNPNDWSYSNITEAPTWLRGYTGHEHLSQFDLINMNGRMYDPVIGRMLRPDNFVQEPTNSQSYNRYSYVFNNPLKYTDPDGEWAQYVIGAILGGVNGWQIGKAAGAKGWGMAGYIVGGAAIGALSGGVGAAIGSSGGIMASTSAIVFSSAISSVGFSALSGGAVDPVISFGAGSYNFKTGELGYLGKKGNTTGQNVGYGLGALANVSDFLAGFNPGEVQLNTEKSDAIGHNAITNVGEKNPNNSIVSVGPDPGGKWIYNPFKFKQGTNRWNNYVDAGDDVWQTPVKGVNVNRVNNYGIYLDRGVKYNLYFSSCVNHAARALTISGAPAIGIHPFILHAQIYLRSIGVRPTLFSYYLQNN